MDAADALAGHGRDLDVTFVAPSGGPRVSHDVVIRTFCICSVADSSDHMVDLGTTFRRVHNSASILSECATCINSNRHDALADGFLQGTYQVRFHSRETADFDDALRFLGRIALNFFSMKGGVRIISLRCLCLFLKITVGSLFRSTIASVVLLIGA